MNDTEKSRCEEFAQALFGTGVDPVDFESTIRISGSYEEFRIRFIAKLSAKDEVAKDIVDRWCNAVELRRDRPDGNALLHTLESISASIVVVEAQLRATSVDLLEKLKAIDVGITALASLQASTDGARVALASMRRQLEMLEEVAITTVESGK